MKVLAASDENLPIITWAIYFNPVEYPGLFVLRKWYAYPGQIEPVPDKEAETFETLYAARKKVPGGLLHLPRTEWDDPSLVETFF